MKSFKEEYAEIKLFCESDEFRREIECTKQRLLRKPVVLYGAGAVGVSAAGVFKHYGIEVNCFCDKGKVGVQNETGLPIISPQKLLTDYNDSNIIICSVNYAEEIERDLLELGISQMSIFPKRFLNFHKMTTKDVLPHLNGYEHAYGLFSDDKSREVLLGRLKCYLTPFPLTLCQLTASPLISQYFDSKIIKLTSAETFVDCGMYTGDTAKQFFKQVDEKYTHYYGFEPDKKNYIIANSNLTGKQNVTLISKGLYNSETRLRFNGNITSSSGFDEAGCGDFVEVTSLDLYFTEKPIPSFIKMDIEGMELQALRGAKNIIREYKPKLAICAYHKPEDPYTLLELIKSYRIDYKFYLRHYTNSIYETVLYAV